jgi:RND family efflux transporter MFP subunit
MADDELSRLKIDKPDLKMRSRKGRRWAGPVVLILAAAVAAALYAGGLLRPAAAVKIAAVSEAYPSQSLALLNASGYVVAQRKAAVASKVTGRLVDLLVAEGDAVKAGQIVARLENDDARAAKDQAQANLAVAHARLDEAKAGLTDASITYERTKRLLGTGAVAQSRYDEVEARYLGVRATVTSAAAAITAAEATLRSAEVALEYTFIRAPFDAVILTKDADVGDIVTPLGAAANAKAAVVTIADMDSLQVEVDVSETSLSEVKVDQPCEIQLDALPGQRLRGAVQAIVPTADRTKASVKVKVRFVDRDPRILPEMSAKVSFLSRALAAGEEKPYVALPRSALANRAGTSSVFVVENGTARLKPVRLGREFGDLVEALEGIKAGEKVVIEPPERLRDGARVRIAEE